MYGVEYYRKMQNMTVAQLAEQTGVGASLITKMARCPYEVTARTALRVADALNITLDQLVEERFDRDSVSLPKKAGAKSNTANPENILEKYRQEKGISFHELALRIGNTTREAGRKACARDKALGKHIRVVAANEGLTVEEFLIRFGGTE